MPLNLEVHFVAAVVMTPFYSTLVARTLSWFKCWESNSLRMTRFHGDLFCSIIVSFYPYCESISHAVPPPSTNSYKLTQTENKIFHLRYYESSGTDSGLYVTHVSTVPFLKHRYCRMGWEGSVVLHYIKNNNYNNIIIYIVGEAPSP